MKEFIIGRKNFAKISAIEGIKIPMKLKLFVDDIRDAPDDSWVVCRKVQDAVSFLYMMNPEEISLDHDIENRPSDETYYPLAHFIGLKHQLSVALDEGKGWSWTPKITIHSMNPVGAKSMIDILNDNGLYAQHIPYGTK